MEMERRKAQRFRGEMYITFQTGHIFFGKPSPMILVKDVSQGGLSFIYPESFPFGNKLLLRLYLPMYTKPVKVSALVKKSERLPNGQYKTGIEFKKIPPDVQKNLEPRAYMSYQARAKEY